MENCGSKIIRVMTELRAKHASGEEPYWGVDGDTGKIVDMRKLEIFQPIAVKMQTCKTAIEVKIVSPKI